MTMDVAAWRCDARVGMARLTIALCVATASATAAAQGGTPAAGTTSTEERAPAYGEPARDGEAAAPEEEDGEEQDTDYLALADAPVFLPRSYLYWGSPVGTGERRTALVFALEYALHLPVYSNLRHQALTGRRWAGTVTLSFEGDLRMLAQESKPVRMPSYRPNISSQVFHIWPRAHPILLSLRTGLFHYSNGQEQCTFSSEYTDDSEACRVLTNQVSDPQRALNDRNGNFSMNGWIAELFGRVHQVNANGVAIGHLALGVLVAGMIRKGPGAMEPALQRLYGWGQVGAALEGHRRFGWASMTARGSIDYYPGSGAAVPAAAGVAEFVLGPYWLSGLGFFARYYGGRDFYNAFFVDRLRQFSAGIAWDGERPLKFGRAEPHSHPF